jgi:hypothetical protein
MADLCPVRLVKAYRGYKAGAVVQATPGLAERLVEDGTAVRETQRSLLEQAGDGRVERAVAAPAVETRSTPYAH